MSTKLTDSPSGEDNQVLCGMEISLAFSHLYLNYSFLFFLVVPKQQGHQQSLQSKAHKYSPNSKNVCGVITTLLQAQ